jgi:hypothetical protein
MPRRILQQELRLTSKTKIPRKRLKVDLSQESELCSLQMRQNVLYLYQSMTFELKIRSLKQSTRLTFKIYTVFTLIARKLS